MDWGIFGKWLFAIVAVLAGGFAIRFVLKIKNTSKNYTTTQKNNIAGGDIIGGDKIENRR